MGKAHDLERSNQPVFLGLIGLTDLGSVALQADPGADPAALTLEKVVVFVLFSGHGCVCFTPNPQRDRVGSGMAASCLYVSRPPSCGNFASLSLLVLSLFSGLEGNRYSVGLFCGILSFLDEEQGTGDVSSRAPRSS